MYLDGKYQGPYDDAFPPDFSPDGRHAGFPALKDGRGFYVVDGKPGEASDGPVPPAGLRFGGGDHVAYPVARRDGAFVVADGKPHPKVLRLDPASLAVSPSGGRVAYTASRTDHPGEEAVVVDGAVFRAYDRGSGVRVGPGTLTFSPDGKRLAYATEGPEATVVVDGADLRRHAGRGRAEQLTFSPDGKRLAYVWSQTGAADAADPAVVPAEVGAVRATVVIDGADQQTFDCYAIKAVHFSPDSKRLAYVVRTAKPGAKGIGYQAVVDGQAGPWYGWLGPGGPQFSPDSARVVYVAAGDSSEAGHGRSVLVDNGRERRHPYDLIGQPTFAPDGRLVYPAVINWQSRVVVDGVEAVCRPALGPGVLTGWGDPDTDAVTSGCGLVFAGTRTLRGGLHIPDKDRKYGQIVRVEMELE